MPSPLGQHLVIRLEDNRVLLTNRHQRRRAARSIYRIARPFQMLAYGFADTHLHVVVLGSRLRALELARRVEIALQRQRRYGVRFLPARATPVRDQFHLGNAVSYVLSQAWRHGLKGDPFFEGSSLPDLLGLRVVGARSRALVQEHLPRFDFDALWQKLPTGPVGEPASAQDLREHLVEACLAATCMEQLGGRGRRQRLVREAAVALVDGALGTAEVAGLLGCSREGLRAVRGGGDGRGLLGAIRGQVGLRSGVRVADPAFQGPSLDASRAVVKPRATPEATAFGTHHEMDGSPAPAG